MDWLLTFAVCVTVAAPLLLVWSLNRWPPGRYFIRPRLKDAWGRRFDIIDRRTDKVVGFDWFTVAKQRCRELNKSR